MNADSRAAYRGDRLNGWKEIASFFQRDERTVKRWEGRRGLPLHRLPGGGSAKVYAYANELNAWLRGEATDGRAAPQPAKVLTTSPPAESSALLAPVIGGMARTQQRVLASFVIALFTLVAVAGWPPASLRTAASPHLLDAKSRELDSGARYRWNARTPSSLQRAIMGFKRAVAHDPTDSQAWSGLADSYNLEPEYALLPTNRAYPLAQAAAKRAVALDPSLADAHASLGFTEFYWSRDLSAARREFERALALAPSRANAHHWWANILAISGNDEEALRQIEDAQRLDPGSNAIMADKGLVLMDVGRSLEAEILLLQVAQTAPNFSPAHSYLGALYLASGRWSDAVRELELSERLRGDGRGLAQAARRGLAAGGGRGLEEALLAKEKKLYAAGSASAFELANAFGMAGDEADALHLLRTSVANKETQNVAIGRGTFFTGLHGNPEFESLERLAGIPTSVAAIRGIAPSNAIVRISG